MMSAYDARTAVGSGAWQTPIVNMVLQARICARGPRPAITLLVLRCASRLPPGYCVTVR